MERNTLFIVVIAMVVILGLMLDWQRLLPGLFYDGHRNNNHMTINSFEDCVSAGMPVMESYPEQCRTEDGRTFVRNIGNELGKTDLIRLSYPRPGDVIGSPLVVTGEARGYWFFEASFPVLVTDWDGKIIGEGYATAEGDWMVEDFVPFTAEVTFKKPDLYLDRGTLILKKDNPSGLPEHDDALEIPISFE